VQEILGLDVSSAVVGLVVVSLAVVCMIGGSLLFPDRESVEKQTGKEAGDDAVLD